jgi:hypothetical protein
MKTLAEVEAAVDELPPAEQEMLLRHLTTRVGRPSPLKRPSLEQWMTRLDTLRTSIRTGNHRAPSEQILSEIRQERT